MSRPEIKLPGADALLRHDGRIVAVALAVLCSLAWIYTVLGVGMDMSALEMTPGLGRSTDMPRPETDAGVAMSMEAPAWSASRWVLVVAMWWVMMIAMMVPSATPTILLAAAINNRSEGAVPPFAGASVFLAGYLLIWLLFSVAATAVQWGFDAYGLLTATMAVSVSGLMAALLVAAGLWQLSPVKHACLRHCRSPLSFLVGRAGSGVTGALRIGAWHGSYCLGCCWSIMALLFVGGVMNLYWIVGLLILVLVEKYAPAGQWIARIAGALLIISGVATLIL